MKRHSAERSRQGTRRSGNGVAQGAAPEAPGRSSWRSPSSQNPHDFQRTTPCLSCCSVCSMTPRCGATGSDSEHRVFSTKTSATRTRSATSESTAMRGAFIGLIFFSLTAGSGAFAGEILASGSDPSASPEKRSPAGQTLSSKGSKRVSRAKPDAHSGRVVTPLVGSGLCLKPSNHPADVLAVSTGGACEPDVDRLLYRSGSRRGPSITARSAGADEEPTGMRATLPCTLTKRCGLP